jgi:hypothetical protein
VPFINYGAQVKQYSVDVAATILLLVLALDLRRPDASTRRLLLTGAVGFVIIWFSQASVIVMGGVGVALAVPIMAFDLPPYEIEHHRAVLAYLQQHRKPGDVIHVFPLSRIGMLFYGPRYGLQPAGWTTAACDRTDTRAYVRDVDRYRGTARVWVLTSVATPYLTARSAVRRYLATIGVKRDSLVLRSIRGEASLDLFDLSDPARLQAATAELFPVDPMPTDPRPGCRPFARPSPLDSF